MSINEIKGDYYYVNPIALERITHLYCQNKRVITRTNTDNFDEILYLEIGATFVGSIFQNHDKEDYVKKGEEKGYFTFGGSTVVIFIKKGKLKIDKDLLKNTKENVETKIFMGEKIGVKI